MTKQLSEAGMQMYRARQAAEGHKQAFADLMADTDRGDARACRAVVRHGISVEDAISGLSTSEAIAVALSFGRTDLLTGEYQDFRYAWYRLDGRQRHLVDTMARAYWLF